MGLLETGARVELVTDAIQTLDPAAERALISDFTALRRVRHHYLNDYCLNEGMVVVENLTLAEYESQYGKSMHPYEYWYGRAIPKAKSSWQQGVLLGVLMDLLREAGYETAWKKELRIDPDARPRPEMIGSKSEIETPHPTKAVDVVVEIPSHEDSRSYIAEKCAKYAEWGFSEIYMVDPKNGTMIYRWNGNALAEIDNFRNTPKSEILIRLGQVRRQPVI